MESIADGNILSIILMVIVGAISGTLAARIAKGDSFGFVVNALLGIAGAVVGGYIFQALKLTPGTFIVKMINETFGVTLPQSFVGMLVSSLVGALIILWISNLVKGRKSRR